MKGMVHNNLHFTGKRSGKTKPHKKNIKKKRVHKNKYEKKGA